MQNVEFVAQSYEARSLPLDAQRCVNMYPEIAPKGAKTPVPVWGCPGMNTFTVAGNGPITAMDVMNDVLYVVSGQEFYQVNSDGSTEQLGQTLISSNQVSIDNNGVQVCWVDGFTGWLYTPGTGVAQITDPNFFPADNVVYFDGYFAFNRKGTKEWFLSNLFDGSTYNALQAASKEATPDLLVGLANTHEMMLLFGQERTEVWYDAGNSPPTFPFQRFDGAFIQRGLIGPLATILEDNTVFFLGDDGIFYRLVGFDPVRISTHATEKAWQSYPTMVTARGFSYTLEGHKFLVLQFPSAPATWVYDIATGKWHERESWMGTSEDSSIQAWRGNCAAMWYDRILIGDSQSGNIGELNFQQYTEFGATMRGLITSNPIHSGRQRATMWRFELDVETGAGLPQTASSTIEAYTSAPVTITGPTELETADRLQGTSSNFAQLFFSAWFYLPDDSSEHGLYFSNQTNDSAPGQPGIQIGVFNDQNSTNQIIVKAWDATGASIVEASYNWTEWTGFVNVMVSLDANGQRLQVGVTVSGEFTLLTAVSIAWSSTLPVANPVGQPWHLLPSIGP